ncbi:hypothetical protein OXPF_06640 [Oxobacter pfennigii]|uniref:Uncharacterized protein n=1 Tax=Oxobacter pfennigii TaxID=36849 RepID=A0A0P8YZX2_9CLOT|nr:hypothetical protein [Oxobacter pfennigii]KPU45431.1 hypothetical protein OXPF_06640 [Oxobacter pfennigii]
MMNKTNKALISVLLLAILIIPAGCRKDPIIVSNSPSPTVTKTPEITPTPEVTPSITPAPEITPTPVIEISDEPTDEEKDILNAKALQMINIMHTGDDVSLKNISRPQDYNRLLEYMNIMESNELKEAAISGYHKNSASEIIVFAEVYFSPEGYGQFYEMKFKKYDDQWYLTDIGFDA